MAPTELAPLIINLRRSVVEGLSREVRRGFDSIPSRRVEIGGLLLGTTVRQTGVIQIEDFEPLEWDGRSDQFVLSESECRALDRTLAAHGSMGYGELNVVGCYRSQIGKGFSVSARDLAFVRSCCQSPTSVFVLIARCSDGALTAVCCAWENRSIDSAYTFHEFPFDVRQLADVSAEAYEPFVSGAAETMQSVAEPRLVEPSLPMVLSEPKVKPTEELAVRVSAWRHSRQLWGTAVLRGRTHVLRSIGALIRLAREYPVAGAAIQRARTQAGVFLNRTLFTTVRTLLRRMCAIPPRAHALHALALPFAVLVIVLGVLGFRAYLSQGSPWASGKHPMMSGHPSNLSRSQLDVVAMPAPRSVRTSAARALVANGQSAAALKQLATPGDRARRKPHVSSGKEPPFTCSPGDVFHKADATPGWDTFTCRGKNVWSLTPTQSTPPVAPS